MIISVLLTSLLLIGTTSGASANDTTSTATYSTYVIQGDPGTGGGGGN
jgi:hypothetical protein